MKRYAVAYVSLFDNELGITFVEAASVRDAAQTVLKYEDVNDLPEDLGDIQSEVWDGDALIDVKELP